MQSAKLQLWDQERNNFMPFMVSDDAEPPCTCNMQHDAQKWSKLLVESCKIALPSFQHSLRCIHLLAVTWSAGFMCQPCSCSDYLGSHGRGHHSRIHPVDGSKSKWADHRSFTSFHHVRYVRNLKSWKCWGIWGRRSPGSNFDLAGLPRPRRRRPDLPRLPGRRCGNFGESLRVQRCREKTWRVGGCWFQL